MNRNTKHNNQFQEVYSELKNEIEKTQQEATKALRVYKNDHRFHTNTGTFSSEDFLNSEVKWNTLDQKFKTLNQIKIILESHNNGSETIEDFDSLDNVLLNYINISKEKELYNITNIFKDYRTKLGLGTSKVDELIKLKIKPESNSQYIKKAFLKACENLDASIFEPLIDEDQYFESVNKYQFLEKMKTQFDYLRGEGVKKVELVLGTCKMCFVGESVYEFYKEPKKGKPSFAYNIQEENGEIKDIFRCNYSDGYQRASREDNDTNITFIND